MQDAIYQISERLTDELCRLQPVLGTYYGVAGYDGSWGDMSPTGWREILVALTAARSEVAELGPSDDPWVSLGQRVHLDYLDRRIGEIERGEMYRDLNSIASPLQTFREVFDIMDRASKENWDDIVARLRSLGDAVDGYIRCLEVGRQSGDVVARRQVLEAIDQAVSFVGEQSPLHQLRADLDEKGFDLRAALVDGIEETKAAFGVLIRYLSDTYLPDSRVADGCGLEDYLRRVHGFLGMEIDPWETYAWGWQEVDRLWNRLEELAVSITGSSDVPNTLRLLKTDPQYAAPTHSAFLDAMHQRQMEALSELDGTHFDVPDQIRDVQVKMAPPGGALGAYYTGPSEDFSRLGIVWYALGEGDGQVPLFDQISTAYHEGFPGHHLQVGVQVSLRESLTRLHRMLIWSPGYGEGWALYTEQLMEELGYFEKPEYVFGMVISQMLRACRVVIDIGSHLGLDIPLSSPFHPGEAWSFEIASEMLQSYASLDVAYAESEVTRYLGWPGQAISYKVGERVIFDLREEMKRQPGFDLKAFHSAVLGAGPVGLDHLREIVLET